MGEGEGEDWQQVANVGTCAMAVIGSARIAVFVYAVEASSQVKQGCAGESLAWEIAVEAWLGQSTAGW